MLMLAKLLLYAGTALLVGGVFARRVLWPAAPLSAASTLARAPGRRWLALGGLLLLLGVALMVGNTLALLGLTSPADALAYLTQIRAGRALLVLLIGALLLLAAELGDWNAPPPWTWLLLVLPAAVLLWGLAGVGHGATHGPTVRLLHTIHAGAMSLWVGGVLALLVSPGAAALARRFSPVATACVLTLALTGTFATLEHAGSLWTLPDSAYGRMLLLKLGLVALALVAAAGVRRALGRSGRLPLALLLEFVLLLGVLGATATLSGQSPPTHLPDGTHSGH